MALLKSACLTYTPALLIWFDDFPLSPLMHLEVLYTLFNVFWSHGPTIYIRILDWPFFSVRRWSSRAGEWLAASLNVFHETLTFYWETTRFCVVSSSLYSFPPSFPSLFFFFFLFSCLLLAIETSESGTRDGGGCCGWWQGPQFFVFVLFFPSLSSF